MIRVRLDDMSVSSHLVIQIVNDDFLAEVVIGDVRLRRGSHGESGVAELQRLGEK
jgi:hypothetical protein